MFERGFDVNSDWENPYAGEMPTYCDDLPCDWTLLDGQHRGAFVKAFDGSVLLGVTVAIESTVERRNARERQLSYSSLISSIVSVLVPPCQKFRRTESDEAVRSTPAASRSTAFQTDPRGVEARIDRTEQEAVEQSVFDLHVIRSTADGTTYEDAIDHLSESEREVTGLIFALAGYLTHDVYDECPFLLLDSIEALVVYHNSCQINAVQDHASSKSICGCNITLISWRLSWRSPVTQY